MKCLIVSILLLACASLATSSLLIGAFNVQVFGQSKMDKPEVVAVLVQIVQRYDVLMIQEIRDSKQTAFPELVDEVNRISYHHYSWLASERTGRTSSKEQYGYIYRDDKVKVIGEYQFPDYNDVFEREPYTVQFRRLDSNYDAFTSYLPPTVPGHLMSWFEDVYTSSPKTRDGPRDFSYVSLHAKPDDAVAELDAMVEVYDAVEQRFGEDVLLAGDFNADCNYVCSSCWSEIDLWTDDRFTWLLDNGVDTTVSTTDCAYDRLVVAGNSLTAASSHASVFRFDLAYGLEYELTKDVSDHYPVEFDLN